MTLAPGSKLGSYEILSAIGAGGMGSIHMAKDTRLGRIVASSQNQLREMAYKPNFSSDT